jgi:hypothetical protein
VILRCCQYLHRIAPNGIVACTAVALQWPFLGSGSVNTLKTVCKSRTGVHLGRFPMVQNSLVAPNRPGYNIWARTTRKTPFLCFCTVVAYLSVAAGTCLSSRCLETALKYLHISRSLLNTLKYLTRIVSQIRNRIRVVCLMTRLRSGRPRNRGMILVSGKRFVVAGKTVTY